MPRFGSNAASHAYPDYAEIGADPFPSPDSQESKAPANNTLKPIDFREKEQTLHRERAYKTLASWKLGTVEVKPTPGQGRLGGGWHCGDQAGLGREYQCDARPSNHPISYDHYNTTCSLLAMANSGFNFEVLGQTGPIGKKTTLSAESGESGEGGHTKAEVAPSGL
jgi:hypothetical protein